MSTYFNETIEELDALLHDSVKIRLRADVPVGAYLSGGLDSSLTTAFIKDIEPGLLNTFSIGFRDDVYDETDYQQEVANYLDTNHTAFKCTAQDIADNFTKTIWHSEYPILRTSPTPMLLLSELVRAKNIKVVITGEGADEFFAGYNIFKEAKIRRFWANEPNSRIRPKLLTKLYPYLPLIKESPDLALKMFFGYKLTETTDPFYSHLLRWRNTSRLNSFLSEDIKASINGYDYIDEISRTLPDKFNDWSDLGKSQYIESKVFMSGYLLSSQGDRMAMANSVEGRYPFLDYRVIEFCSALPENYKLNSLNEKFILKKLSSGRIPSSITKRSKQAYRSPIIDSFNNTTSPKLINELLSEETLKKHQIFDSQKVFSLLNNLKQQRQPGEIDQMALVGILSTQILHQLFVLDSIKPNPDNLNNYRLINDN
jgi:asparagine synthase (glutamine-hydrolysing)